MALPLCQHVSLLFVNGVVQGHVGICFLMTSILASIISPLQYIDVLMITNQGSVCRVTLDYTILSAIFGDSRVYSLRYRLLPVYSFDITLAHTMLLCNCVIQTHKLTAKGA